MTTKLQRKRRRIKDCLDNHRFSELFLEELGWDHYDTSFFDCLVDNIEFNVELKNRSDYESARKKFEDLWRNAVDVSEKYVQIIQDKTWLSQNITPWQLYLKFLYKNIDAEYPGKVLLFTGDSGESVRDKVIENFDARARHKSDEYRILISTEVLSEGVNLHRANCVINYDIPWNPTRMMQRPDQPRGYPL